MKKYINYLIFLSLIVCLSSCTLQIPSSNKDGEGNGNGTNQPPIPGNMTPNDGATEVPLTPLLCWECNGPNNYNVRFDIYLDTQNPPNLIIESGSYNMSYFVSSPLEANKTYYWKIRAMNDNGESVSSVCRFTTAGGALPQGLVAYYPFKGNTNDESGNNNNGYNNGAVLIPDRFTHPNTAYSFNGSNSYIMVPHNSTLQPTGGLTISAWVKLNNLNSTGSILAKGNETSIGFYSLRYESSSHTFSYQVNFTDYIPGQELILNSTTSVQVNTWYYVVGTFDGTTMEIYKNGQFENSMYATLTLGSNNESLMIGSCEQTYFMNGAIDDIRIFNRKLSSSEILEFYNESGLAKK